MDLRLSFFSFLLCWPLLFWAQNYQNAESSEYDPVNRQWLTANGGNIIADDGQGNLSFFGAASASHGMEVIGNVLFAIDDNILKGYDLTTQETLMTLIFPGVVFLNGMTTDGNSTLYVTDFSIRKIFQVDVSDLQNPSIVEVVGNTGTTPNGIIHDEANNRLIFVSWGSNAAIRAVDLSTFDVSTIVNTNLTNIDGIDEDNEGNYYISSWSPSRITKYDKNFTNPPEVINTPFISNPADIGYSRATDTLAIPIGNNVVFVGFADSDTTSALPELATEEFQMTIAPNPVDDHSFIRFKLDQPTDILLQIVDGQGRVVKTLVRESKVQGIRKVLLAGLDLPQGTYYCHLRSPEKVAIRKLLIVR